MDNIVYRSFNEKDAQGVYETALEAWRHTYRDVFDPTFIENFVNTNYATERLVGLIPHLQSREMFFYVAEHDDKVIGYCNIWFPSDQAELLRIYVRPKFIGQGVGFRLLQEGEIFLKTKSTRSYFCYVHEKNETGKRFYERNHFFHLMEHDKVGEWYMEKKLG